MTAQPPAPRLKSFTFQTSAAWQEGVEGLLSSPGLPNLAVSTPPELRGPAGRWGPETLYIAAIEACLMLTFLALARSKGLTVAAYSSDAEGLLEPIDGLHVVSKVTVRPQITVKTAADIPTAQALAAQMHERCFISNSVESEVVVEPSFSIAS